MLQANSPWTDPRRRQPFPQIEIVLGYPFLRLPPESSKLLNSSAITKLDYERNPWHSSGRGNSTIILPRKLGIPASPTGHNEFRFFQQVPTFPDGCEVEWGPT